MKWKTHLTDWTGLDSNWDSLTAWTQIVALVVIEYKCRDFNDADIDDDDNDDDVDGDDERWWQPGTVG